MSHTCLPRLLPERQEEQIRPRSLGLPQHCIPRRQGMWPPRALLWCLESCLLHTVGASSGRVRANLSSLMELMTPEFSSSYVTLSKFLTLLMLRFLICGMGTILLTWWNMTAHPQRWWGRCAHFLPLLTPTGKPFLSGLPPLSSCPGIRGRDWAWKSKRPVFK